MTRIAIASDHAGYQLKETLKARLQRDGYEVSDFGTDSDAPVDYPDHIRPAAASVAQGKNNLGIVLGGSGNGEAMVANKVRGIRCALCWNEESARLAKQHNNANMISIGARMVGEREAISIVDTWLKTEFEYGRHVRRIEKIEQGGEPIIRADANERAPRSERISRTGVITLNAPLERVFPLFGPIREQEWAAGWEPQVIYTTTDLMEEHMVFKTQSHDGHGPDSTWTISQYRPDQAFMEYTVFDPESLWRITIQCREGMGGETTTADITYTCTGLTENGNVADKKALETMYRRELKDWEEAINHYLATGQRLEHGEAIGDSGGYASSLPSR